MSYKIIPSKREQKYVENDLIPDHMPKVPFRMLCVASSQSGKTQTVGSLLRQDEFKYNKIFSGNIFLMSSTASLDDPAFDQVNLKKENVFDHYDEGVIAEIVQDQEDLIKDRKKEGAPHVLLIIDDLLCELPQSRQSSLINLFLSGRHRKISIIICSQIFRGCIPKGVRLNTTSMLIWRCNNKEQAAIAEEQGGVNTDDFISMLEYATKEPYSFLYINNQKANVNERYYKNFEEQLSIE